MTDRDVKKLTDQHTSSLQNLPESQLPTKMKFSIAAFVLTLAASEISSASALAVRAGAPGDAQISCDGDRAKIGQYNGDFSQACVRLVNDCHRTLNNTKSIDVWAHRSCVAGATCSGVNLVSTIAQCDNTAVPGQVRLANLSTAVFEEMTAGCSSKKSCSMSHQNYIDFFYGSLSAINSNVWPNSTDQVTNWWNAITSWTKTGDTIPYHNFNDWLHLVFDANSNPPSPV
ncbi:hypothetical protein D9758_002475 [Tetrapyrgos nigripes]|uniref:Uncharacterized protein n=1 Tax=Tetrapyrgos nigripes TaxID=182062 RepID=A0A8H5GNV5_9AGAR|nr:hypothetical protein D9758_002475 [Tetrapyrgos nigripes]